MILINDDAEEAIKKINTESIDMVLTSPPYDSLREYTGDCVWNFEKFSSIANELFRVIKQGGVVVWIVSDETIKGNESGSSFRQALYFKEIGFNLHDTMIWQKSTFSAVGALKVRYAPVFEYMFVFSKGKPKAFNPIKDRKNKWGGTKQHGTVRQQDGTTKAVSGIKSEKVIAEYGQRFNVWQINEEKVENKFHPAVFPEQLAFDHIISWSNEGDLILDPFMGSGTTGKACINSNRNFIGIEISKDYYDYCVNRLKN